MTQRVDGADATQSAVRIALMPTGLQRFHHTGHWHFITCGCYRRQPFLGSARRRDLFLEMLEQVREKYDFGVAGYVAMPEHFHLMISEPRMVKLFGGDAGAEAEGFTALPRQEEQERSADAALAGGSCACLLAARVL